MKTLFASLIVIISGVALAKVTINWIDYSFVTEYASAHHIPATNIRISNSNQECLKNEYFDDTYGLCVVDSKHTVTNTKVDMQ